MKSLIPLIVIGVVLLSLFFWFVLKTLQFPAGGWGV